ncbi:MAG: hypothetical protein E7536_04035 [Ruminococcaceae bacterium]|nr:hypothetical protein [Oscillospiraceae bacterium]
MAICNKCGQYVGDAESECRKCGNVLIPVQEANDSKPVLFGIIGFLLSVLGVFWGILWKTSHPKRAKALIIGGSVGLAVITLIKLAGPMLVLYLLH